MQGAWHSPNTIPSVANLVSIITGQPSIEWAPHIRQLELALRTFTIAQTTVESEMCNIDSLRVSGGFINIKKWKVLQNCLMSGRSWPLDNVEVNFGVRIYVLFQPIFYMQDNVRIIFMKHKFSNINIRLTRAHDLNDIYIKYY